MIEVNLLPGGKKRAARGKRAAMTLPSLPGVPKDRWVLAAVVFAVSGAAAAGWLLQSVSAREGEAEVALARVVQDSARYSDLIEHTNTLMARRDSIVQRVAVIQEIDQGRYVWPHILDEVARALPDYTWLLQLQQVSGSTGPRIRIGGQAGSIQAVSVFMDQLQASPFLRDVRLIGTSSILRQPENQLVYRFDLEALYEQPPIDFLETVPLLGAPPADVDVGADPDGL